MAKMTVSMPSDSDESTPGEVRTTSEKLVVEDARGDRVKMEVDKWERSGMDVTVTVAVKVPKN